MSSAEGMLGVAVIGAGIFAREAHVPALNYLKDMFQIKAIYSRSKKSAEELAELVPGYYTINLF